MKNIRIGILNSVLIVTLIFLFSCQNKTESTSNWQSEFQQKMPYLGHRNWVLVVDKAFPMQSAQGITIINTGEQLPVVLEKVIATISKSTHVKPIIYTDMESTYMKEDFVKGVDTLQKKIHNSLRGFPVNNILHEKIFAKLDSTSKLYNVVVLKTETTIAYSSVFIQLDCAYWDSNKENKLRQKMSGEK